jgi:hypothetical protein
MRLPATASRRFTLSRLTWRILLGTAGLLLLCGGILRGDVEEMWRRATQICLGCIGIG